MARDHARIYTAIWNDPDWRKLDQPAQHMYLMLTSQPRLSYCGMLDFLPSRLAQLVTGLTEAKVREAIRRLERSKFVVLDRETHELLVRSYVRHDGVLARRNMGNAVARALGMVQSQTIRESVLHELARIFAEDSTLAGWDGFKDYDPIAYAMACDMASAMQWPMPTGDDIA